MEEKLQSVLKFPYLGFVNHQERIVQWEKAALDILKSIKEKNVGFVAETGSGKTIIAFYCLVALKKRTLFLAPTKILCRQHERFYKKVTGRQDSFVIVGENSKNQRPWQNQEKKVIFATPHVFLADQKKGLVSSNDFNLLIIDECHKASKKYPYVKIAQQFASQLVNIISMSASPGRNQEAIIQITKNCQLNTWNQVNIETPDKINVPIFIDLDKNLILGQEILNNLKQGIINEIKKFSWEKQILKRQSIDEIKNFIPMKIFNFLEKTCQKLTGRPFYLAKQLLAQYLKIMHLEKLFLTESYFNFLEYADKLKKQDTVSGKNIVAQKAFTELIELASQNINGHPKLKKLLEVLQAEKKKQQQGLIFLGNKQVALYLARILKAHNLSCACLFGGQGKSVKSQQFVIKGVKDKEIDFVLATSVVEEGLSVPSFDFVLNYSLPDSPVSQLQRSGRTGRFREGKVFFLIMEIESERIKFFSNFSSLKKMEKIVYQKKSITKKKKAYVDPNQLSLF